jgi:hypothetical protein
MILNKSTFCFVKSVENTGKTNLISENGKIYFLYSSPFSQKKEAPGTAEGFFFHFSITADTTVILQLFSVTGGTFPARWFTIFSR